MWSNTLQIPVRKHPVENLGFLNLKSQNKKSSKKYFGGWKTDLLDRNPMLISNNNTLFLLYKIHNTPPIRVLLRGRQWHKGWARKDSRARNHDSQADCTGECNHADGFAPMLKKSVHQGIQHIICCGAHSKISTASRTKAQRAYCAPKVRPRTKNFPVCRATHAHRRRRNSFVEPYNPP